VFIVYVPISADTRRHSIEGPAIGVEPRRYNAADMNRSFAAHPLGFEPVLAIVIVYAF
jgi:hypothetical protein